MLENKGIRSFLLRMVTYKVFELGLFGGSIVQRKFGIGIYIETEKKLNKHYQLLPVTNLRSVYFPILPCTTSANLMTIRGVYSVNTGNADKK
jgi:hypothetical protein